MSLYGSTGFVRRITAKTSNKIRTHKKHKTAECHWRNNLQIFTNKYKVFLTDINTWFACYWKAQSFSLKAV